MKLNIEWASNQIKSKKTLILTALVFLFDTTLYLVRGSKDELSTSMDVLDILVVVFCPLLIALAGIFVLLAGLLIFKVIQHGFRKSGSLIPLISLVAGTVLAYNLPIPSLPEEALFNKHQEDFEYIVMLAKSNQLEHGDECLADFPPSYYAYKIPEGYEYLSEECIFVSYYADDINVEFSPYYYAVVLNYFEDPNDVTKNDDCAYEGPVWRKKINRNWYVCKKSIH